MSGHDPLYSAIWLTKKVQYRRNQYSTLADEVIVAKRNTPTSRSLTKFLKSYGKLATRQKFQLFAKKDNNYQSMRIDADKDYRPLSPLPYGTFDPLEGVEVCIPTSPTSTLALHLIIPAVGKPELRSRESSTSLCSTQNSTLEDQSERRLFDDGDDNASFFTFTRDDMPPEQDVDMLDEEELLGLQFLEDTEDDELFFDNISVLTPGSL